MSLDADLASVTPHDDFANARMRLIALLPELRDELEAVNKRGEEAFRDADALYRYIAYLERRAAAVPAPLTAGEPPDERDGTDERTRSVRLCGTAVPPRSASPAVSGDRNEDT